MMTVPVSTLPLASRFRPRTALVASADRSFRQRLTETLIGLRWQVREAEGGAQAWTEAEAVPPEAVIVDSWLPDLDLAEFLKDFRAFFPNVDLLTASGAVAQESPRGPYRQELLYALRRSQDSDTAAWNVAPALTKPNAPLDSRHVTPWPFPASDAAAPQAFSPQSDPSAAIPFLPEASRATFIASGRHPRRSGKNTGTLRANRNATGTRESCAALPAQIQPAPRSCLICRHFARHYFAASRT